MKTICTKLVMILVMLISPFISRGQWVSNGDSYTSGKVGIGTSTPAFDIDISRNVTDAGLRVYNSNWTGRSVLVFGQGTGGHYGYAAHHGQSHVSDPGYTLTFKPSSTVLVGADVNGLGIISAQDIRFNAGGLDDTREKMRINANGNVGIGTQTPSGQFHLASNNDHEFKMTRSNGTYGFRIFRIASSGRFLIQNTDDNNVWGTRLQIEEGGSNWQNLFLNPNGGNVGIGTTSPDAKLAVNGQIHATEVKVTAAVPGPDYVFDEDYALPSLDSVQSYINQNKHLPEVPSAKEMEANGINVGEMNMLLLKKVEELTLYVMQMNTRLDKLEKENQELKK